METVFHYCRIIKIVIVIGLSRLLWFLDVKGDLLVRTVNFRFNLFILRHRRRHRVFSFFILGRFVPRNSGARESVFASDRQLLLSRVNVFGGVVADVAVIGGTGELVITVDIGRVEDVLGDFL